MGKRLAFVALGFAAIFTIAMTFMTVMAVRATYLYAEVDEGWEAAVNGTPCGVVTLTRLEDADVPVLEKGDTLTLKRELPDTEEVPFPTVTIKLRYGAVEVFLEDEEVYSYGMEAFAAGAFVGTKQHFILLPRGCSGKELRIELHADKDHPFYYIEAPYFGNYDDVMQIFLHGRMMSFVSGIYLVVFGILFFAISLFFLGRVPEMKVTLVSALLCFALGVWILARYDLIDIFFRVPDKTIVEYVAFYTVPILLCITVWVTHNYITKKGFFLYAVPVTLIVAWNLFGVLMGAFTINRFQYPFLAATAIVNFGVLIEGIYCFRSKLETADQIQMVSVVLLNAFLVGEFIVYTRELHSPWIHAHFSGVILPAGGLFFSLGQIMNFFIFVTRAYVRRAEAASLRRMAYEDILTGLPNRASYDREMRALDADGGRYCIISMDLNGLKETNDTLGHAVGDELLSSFGRKLQEAFDIGFCSRIGGDEFVVILRGASMEGNKEDIERRLALLDKELHELDVQDARILHSTAYGYAFSEEREHPTAHDIFLLADSRMYECKRLQHSLMNVSGGEAGLPEGTERTL